MRATLTDKRLDDRFDSIHRRFDSLERRFDSLEGRFDTLQRTMTLVAAGNIATLISVLATRA